MFPHIWSYGCFTPSGRSNVSSSSTLSSKVLSECEDFSLTSDALRRDVHTSLQALFLFLLFLHVQKLTAFLFFFLTWLFAFLCLKFDRDGCFCLFDVVCVGPSRERCGARCVSDTADDTEAWRVPKHPDTFLTPAFEDLLL